MNCSNCSLKNVSSANYCIKCGHKFTEEEKKKAYKKTFYYKLDNVEKWYHHLTLSTITGSIYYKIGSILVLLIVGIYLLLTVGVNTKILNSKDYKIFYNEDEKVYYLLVDNDKSEVSVNLYKPNRLKELSLEHFNQDNELIENVDLNKEIVLKTFNNDYYVFNSIYSDNKEDKMIVMVYREKDLS